MNESQLEKQLQLSFSKSSRDHLLNLIKAGALVEDLSRWAFIDNPEDHYDEDFKLGAENLADFMDGFLTCFGRDFLNYIEDVEVSEAHEKK